MQNPKNAISHQNDALASCSVWRILGNRSYYLISVFLTDLIGGGNFSSL
jgi:hypothetical protein